MTTLIPFKKYKNATALRHLAFSIAGYPFARISGQIKVRCNRQKNSLTLPEMYHHHRYLLSDHRQCATFHRIVTFVITPISETRPKI
jgi:hypothetical protein